MATVTLDGASITLPEGWAEHPNQGGPREFRSPQDGAGGLLQVSKISDEQLGWLSAQEDLGAVAGEMGRRMDFSSEAVTRAGLCNFGRYGFAMFQGGRFPAMFLWVTLSREAAFLWTWLGPDPTSTDAQAAVALVLSARNSSV